MRDADPFHRDIDEENTRCGNASRHRSRQLRA
jgi:hypothetical protein